MPVAVYTEVEIKVGDTWLACNGEEIKIIKKNDPVGENSHPTYGGRGETTKEYRQYYHDGHTTIDGYTVFDLKELKLSVDDNVRVFFASSFKSMIGKPIRSPYPQVSKGAMDKWLELNASGANLENVPFGEDPPEKNEQVEGLKEKQPEYTGGSVSYYSVPITNPTTPGRQPYIAECNDIIEALNMSYAEGNALKAIWRVCAATNLGLMKAGYKDKLYDSEKVVFFGGRMVERAKEQ